MKYLLILILILVSHPISIDLKKYLVVWNVGQGQMASLILPAKSICVHIDMGGEVLPTPGPFEICRYFINAIVYSHWDWDHISFTQKHPLLPRGLCALHPPPGHPPNKLKAKTVALPKCAATLNSVFKSIKALIPPHKFKLSKLSSNDNSQVYLIDNKILLPGDSTAKMEKSWSKNLQKYKIETLVAGHHGSRTSTSTILLEALPDLKHVISSARKKKYGHPHWEVQQRLQKQKKPLLTTEAFNHIWIEI